jgi:hypothetical protein
MVLNCKTSSLWILVEGILEEDSEIAEEGFNSLMIIVGA